MSAKLTWLGASEHTKFTSFHNFINSPYYHLFIMSSTEGITATSSLSSFITDHVTTHLRGCHCHVNSIYHCHHVFTCQVTLLSSSTSWHSKWGQCLTAKTSLWLSLFQACHCVRNYHHNTIKTSSQSISSTTFVDCVYIIVYGKASSYLGVSIHRVAYVTTTCSSLHLYLHTNITIHTINVHILWLFIHTSSLQQYRSASCTSSSYYMSLLDCVLVRHHHKVGSEWSAVHIHHHFFSSINSLWAYMSSLSIAEHITV